MLMIPCIHCGPRNVSEFRYSGETGARPDPNAVQPDVWRSYLYDKANKADWTRERWFHAAGCRRFFTIERHTLTNEIRAAGSSSEPI